MVKAIITTMYMKTWRKEKKSVYCIVFDDMMLRCEMWSVLHANEWQRIDKAGNWCRHWTVSVTICINSLPNGCIWSPKSNTMSESALALSSTVFVMTMIFWYDQLQKITDSDRPSHHQNQWSFNIYCHYNYKKISVMTDTVLELRLWLMLNN